MTPMPGKPVNLRHARKHKARAEARRIVEAAKEESSTITMEATAKAQQEAEKILADARAEGQGTVSNAQAEEQEILGKAQRESMAVINASQARADNVESNARLRAEFIIRQMNQVVYDSIRRAVTETCQDILPDLDNITVHQLGQPTPDEGGTVPGTESQSLERAGDLDQLAPSSKDQSAPNGQSSSGETRSTTQPSTRRKARSTTDKGRTRLPDTVALSRSP